MASYTTNLNLKKPAGSENVAIGDINNNMDTIDQAYGTLNSNVTPMTNMLKMITFKSSSPATIQFDSAYFSLIMIGLVQGYKEVMWAIYKNGPNNALVIKDIISGQDVDLSTTPLSISYASNVLTIATTQAGASNVTVIKSYT